MYLHELLPVDKLGTHIDQKIVNVQRHPSLPLVIYNYGVAAQYGNIWDDVTVHCRGLIVNAETNEIVARPFRKFFNLNTDFWPESQMANLPAEDPEITTKLDGSLGILYRFSGKTEIATRGSFMSDQSQWATRWYNERMWSAVWPEGWTPLFEIIYPENRIVVRYEWSGLGLLAMVNNETGEEMPYKELVRWLPLNGIIVGLHQKRIEECAAEDCDNEEGYVATWHREGTYPIKVKIKLPEYVRLHRLITGISPREIWRMMSAGESFNDLTTNVPKHYLTWVDGWRSKLGGEYGRLESKAQDVYANRPIAEGNLRLDRKRMAAYFKLPKNDHVSAICFKMLDGQPYSEIIWKLVRSLTANIGVFKADE